MSKRDRLEIVLEFLGRPLVWLTLCVAALVVLVSNGTVDLALLEQVLDAIGGTLADLKPW